MQPPARQMPIPAPFHNDPPAGVPGRSAAARGLLAAQGRGPAARPRRQRRVELRCIPGAWAPLPAAPTAAAAAAAAAGELPGDGVPPPAVWTPPSRRTPRPPTAAASRSSWEPWPPACPRAASCSPRSCTPVLPRTTSINSSSTSSSSTTRRRSTDHLGIQFGQMQFSSSSFGGATGGFGGSYSESPAFGDGPPTSSFSEPSTSAFGPGAVPVLSTNESLASNAGANGVLSHEGSGLAVGGASFKTAGPPGGPTAASPSGHAADDFAQPGASQRSGSIGLPATSSAVPGGGQYSAFAQPKAQEPPQSHSSAGQYSQYGYNQQFGGSAAFGQVRIALHFCISTL